MIRNNALASTHAAVIGAAYGMPSKKWLASCSGRFSRCDLQQYLSGECAPQKPGTVAGKWLAGSPRAIKCTRGVFPLERGISRLFLKSRDLLNPCRDCRYSACTPKLRNVSLVAPKSTILVNPLKNPTKAARLITAKYLNLFRKIRILHICLMIHCYLYTRGKLDGHASHF